MIRRYYDSKDEALTIRPSFNLDTIKATVEKILEDVKKGGDRTVLEYERTFDSPVLESLVVSQEEFDEAEKLVDESLREAIEKAYSNIKAFHEIQKPKDEALEVQEGVKLWRKTVAIEKVGLYIPGGSAPLFSTVLMLGVPSQIAGCRSVVMCTPPQKNGKVNPAVLYAAKLCSVTKVIKAGGAVAIAAMAYGTKNVPKVSKIFGPGNRYVMLAKQIVSSSLCSIDMPAGPSEVLVACDKLSSPVYCASDLLSQAEHGGDSQAIMAFCGDKGDYDEFCDQVQIQIDKQRAFLDRNDILDKALENSFFVYCNGTKDLSDFINDYAPEHLIITTGEPQGLLDSIVNAGSVFLGPYSCESAGDYASGTNHTLPTSMWSKSTSGVSLDSFIKKITVQSLSKKGLRDLGNTIMTMAQDEGLTAHRRAVELRLEEDEDENR